MTIADLYVAVVDDEAPVRTALADIDLPIGFTTANEQLDLGPAASEAGAVRLLRKPFSNAALLEAIGAAIRHNPSDPSRSLAPGSRRDSPSRRVRRRTTKPTYSG